LPEILARETRKRLITWLSAFFSMKFLCFALREINEGREETALNPAW